MEVSDERSEVLPYIHLKPTFAVCAVTGVEALNTCTVVPDEEERAELVLGLHVIRQRIVLDESNVVEVCNVLLPTEFHVGVRNHASGEVRDARCKPGEGTKRLQRGQHLLKRFERVQEVLDIWKR